MTVHGEVEDVKYFLMRCIRHEWREGGVDGEKEGSDRI